MSEEHARLEAALGSWFLADLGSKNQTRLDGEIVDRAKLTGTAGDVELGDLSAEQIEIRAELVRQLEEHDGNISAVARSMGKARQQVQRWVRRFQLKS